MRDTLLGATFEITLEFSSLSRAVKLILGEHDEDETLDEFRQRINEVLLETL